MVKTKQKQKQILIVGSIFLAVVALTVLALYLYPKAPEDTLSSRNLSDFMEGNYPIGMDVSEYQGEIDWHTVADSGIRFVFIKVGSRGTTEGNLYPDSMAQSYYAGAKDAGLQVGAYFFSQAITVEEAEAEAQFALEQISGWKLDLPVVYDWEWGGDGSRTTGVSQDTLTQCAESFCKIIADAGLAPMLYFNEYQGLAQMDLERLSQYPFWLAQYDGELTFPHPFSYWQYTCTGTVPGISGNVDLNIQILEE